MSLESLYPSMFAQPAAVAVTAPVASAPRENIGMRLPAGDNSPAVELQPNRGIALQAGDTTIEKADAAPTPESGNHHETVNSVPAPAPLTEETVAAAIPPEVKAERDAQREARGNTYNNTFSHLLRDGTDPQVKLVNREIGNMLADHGASVDDASSLVYVARKFDGNPPDAETLKSWQSLVTPQERAAADAAMQRDPRIKALAAAFNIAESPQLIRLLANRRK